MEQFDAAPQLVNQYTDYSDSHGNVKLLSAMLYGVVITVVALGLAWSGKYFWPYYHEMYFQRGPIPFITTLLFSVSIAMLVLKYLWYRDEKKVYVHPYVNYYHQSEKDLTESHVAQSPHVDPGDPRRQTILVSRIIKATTRWEKTHSTSAVDGILQASSDLDAELVENSYSLINFFTWVIPILGFLGTVIGVGSAIGGFGTIIDAASSGGGFDAIRDNIGSITGSLSLAFDTTLLALIYSAVIMFIASIQKKLDNDMLSGFDQFCHENVMGKLLTRQPVSAQAPGDGGAGSTAQLQVLEKIASQLENLNTGRSPDQDSAQLEALQKIAELLADTNQGQVEKLLEEINTRLSSGTDTSELNDKLQEICSLLTTNRDVITFGEKIEQLINSNLELAKLPESVDGLKSEMTRLGAMFAQIYGKQY